MAEIGHNSRRAIQTVFRTGSSGNHYTIMSNKMLQDTRLKADTRGLVAMLLSRPENWMIKVAHIVKNYREGREKVYRMIKEASDLGYMGKLEIRDDMGVIRQHLYYVTDDPDLVDIQALEVEHSATYRKPESGSSTNGFSAHGVSEKPTSGKPARLQRKDNIQKKDKKRSKPSFDQFWALYPRKQGKAEAKKKWTAMKAEECWKAIESIPLYKRDVGEDGIFQHAKTYLNQETYDDYDDVPVSALWYDHPKAWAMSQEYYLEHLDKHKPNGTWMPRELGPLEKWKATPNASKAIEKYKFEKSKLTGTVN